MYDALSTSQAREAELREKLEAEIVNKKQFERDWLDARDKLEFVRIVLQAAEQRAEAAEACIASWQQGENEDLTAEKRKNAELEQRVKVLTDALNQTPQQSADQVVRGPNRTAEYMRDNPPPHPGQLPKGSV